MASSRWRPGTAPRQGIILLLLLKDPDGETSHLCASEDLNANVCGCTV